MYVWIGLRGWILLGRTLSPNGYARLSPSLSVIDGQSRSYMHLEHAVSLPYRIPV